MSESVPQKKGTLEGKTAVLGYCHGGMTHQAFTRSLCDAIWFDCAQHNLLRGTTDAQGCLIPVGRNLVVEQFLAMEDGEGGRPEWLLMVDTDIGFAHDAPYRLLAAADARERPIVAGLYFTPIAGRVRPIWMGLGPSGELAELDGILPGVQPLGACGMGFTAIHRSVLLAMKERHGPAEKRWAWFGHDPGPDGRLGEDYTFCARARALGASIWGHSGVELQHHKATIIERVDYDMTVQLAAVQARAREPDA